ncbi:MAG: hypothetical protein P8186_15310 [Anaerolineae bacterium]|jgi:hypothetical protein
MFLNLTPEERKMLEPVARVEAMEFLEAQLKAVEAKIEKRKIYLLETYPEAKPPRGEAELLEIYQQEKLMIQELMQETQQKFFVDVLRQRTERAQRRVLELNKNGATWPKQWEARTEWEILSELRRGWLARLKT